MATSDPLPGTWPKEVPSEIQDRILVLAPTANDARLTCSFLSEAGFNALIVTALAELCAKVIEGCGAILIAEESLPPSAAERLFGLLSSQPPWSDIPITLVSNRTSYRQLPIEHVATASNTNIALLERPFRPETLVKTIEVALRSRRRQYEVQKLLQDLVQARDAAQQASRAKDEFLAALSHELRTPLNPVLLVATDAAANTSLPEPVRSDFELIARNVALEAQLIDDLLDLTRITHDKLKLDLQRLDAHEALRAALATTQSEMLQKLLTVHTKWTATNSIILGDLTRLQQVFWNVLKNAAKFTQDSGNVVIETYNRGACIVIKITDNGMGMDAADLDRVFNAFAQGKNTASGGHRFGGLGLGLAITRKLVELHQGIITAHSDGPGTGASFTLTFPLALMEKPMPSPTPKSPAQPNQDSHGKLLIVEDHGPTRLSLAQLLRRRGYDVTLAATLAEARKQLETHSFDIVLSDLGLPDGNGYELADCLRAQPSVRAIALSGYGTEADVVRSHDAGFKVHLTKPVGVQALDAALNSFANEKTEPVTLHPIETAL